jgi:DNA-binding transcriptional MerR regulator
MCEYWRLPTQFPDTHDPPDAFAFATMEEAMQCIDSLVEQHIRESECHLRHIDELMAKASQPPIEASAAPELRTLLSQVRKSRAQLAQELDELRRGLVDGDGPSKVQRGEGLNSALQAVGLQLEQALTAILDFRGL